MAGLFDRLQDELERRDAETGISPMDLLDMSPELQSLVQHMARRGPLPAPVIAAELDLPADEVQQVLDDLVAKGFARVTPLAGEQVYKVVFGRRRRRELPVDLWQALAEKTDPPPPADT